MKLIKTEDAVGHVLCHDITQIIKGVTKDAVFRKGHIVKKEDIPVLLSVGKEHLYVWQKEPGMLHEDEAAEILRDICFGNNMEANTPKEGKIELIAKCDGILKVDSEILTKINSLGEMMIATRHGNFPIKKGDKLAGTRIIPLIIEEEKMNTAKQLAGTKPILDIIPYVKKRVGIVTTGSEVYYHRIEDTFTPVLIEKCQEYQLEVIGHKICNDEHQMITKAILELIDEGCEIILCSGGMSVDPDDRTPLAIKNTGAKVISYGAPVLPGAMFMLAYYNDVAIMGLPGCVMYAKRTIFDLVLPRVAAGEKLIAQDLFCLGQGGLCLSCPVCTFPNCGFGKG